MTDRLRRSFLYTPGNDREMMEKTAEAGADAVIFDLEDAVPTEQVPVARETVQRVTADTDFGGTEVCVRINGLHTDQWREDLRTVATSGVDTVVLPMVETPAQLSEAVATAAGAGGDALEFLPILETPTGVFDAKEIARTGADENGVTGLSFGIGDYTRAIGATGEPESVREFVSHLTVGAATIGGLDPIHTVFMDYADTDGLRETAETARKVGFTGMKAIHPGQIAVINDVFTPSPDEVERARRFVTVFDDADSDSITVDGTFLDTAIVEQYRTVLQRHEEVTGSE